MRTPFAEFLVQNGLVSADVAQRTSDWCMRTRIPIGLIAVGHGLISGTNIDDVLEHQRDTCVRFGEAAVEMRLLSQRQVDTLLEIQRFREAAEIAEGLALMGQLTFRQASLALGDFLRQQITVDDLDVCTQTRNG